MKRRELKKTINYLCGDLFAECIAILHFQVVVNKEDVDNVMIQILKMQDEMLRRISHVEPGSTKFFFKRLNEDLITKSNYIIEQIKALA